MNHLIRSVPNDLIISVRNDLPPGITASTDGQRTIWLRKGLTRVQARCAVHHELVHIKYGHTQRQPERIEHRVRAETARNLLDVPRMIEAWKWSCCLSEMAAELSVTETVLTDRLDALTPAESAVIFNRMHNASVGA